MSKSTKTLDLPKSGLKAFLHEELSFGQYLDIECADYDLATVEMTPEGKAMPNIRGSAMARIEVKKMEVVIDHFEDSEGKKIDETKLDTIKNLPQSDGQLLQQTIKEIIGDGKKK